MRGDGSSTAGKNRVSTSPPSGACTVSPKVGGKGVGEWVRWLPSLFRRIVPGEEASSLLTHLSGEDSPSREHPSVFLNIRPRRFSSCRVFAYGCSGLRSTRGFLS